MDNERAMFYRYRTRFNDLLSSGQARTRESACLFYYLNRTGYNGLCRFNRRGQFNVPFGRYATVRYTSDFSAYRSRFAGWEFSAVDIGRLRFDAGDFVYADPPYDVEFTQYSKEGFGWDNQRRLADWLARHPGPVVLSNQATDRVVRLYRGLGFDLEFVPAQRMISCNGDRTKAIEVIATRNLPVLKPSPTSPVVLREPQDDRSSSPQTNGRHGPALSQVKGGEA
jgi:DNA adenine methylase